MPIVAAVVLGIIAVETLGEIHTRARLALRSASIDAIRPHLFFVAAVLTALIFLLLFAHR